MYAAIVDMLVKGGPVMVPLGIVSVMAVAISIERLWYFAKLRHDDGDHLMDELRVLVHEGRLLEAMQSIRRVNGPTAAVLAEGLAAWDRPIEEVRSRVERVGQDEVLKLEARMAWLDAIVTGAPMLGLLGTVTGIIRSFRILANMQGVEPTGLSSGIAEALITTAAGLIIAIPVLFIHVYLSSIIDQRVAQLNRTTAELLQLLTEVRGRS
ncbi:MotA/TolQ/ExbB proton channel family protein [Carboxydochorda subterranea]|uniref:MotA/TolQ/ExbB proton channel family protein n=1 Tax=Carboxydichorda subterranea TaxID=3109565 RepID=A0ABZ1C0T3_9FIRM|nr:MotA/TolQ/ExbB proton channel family protein [Limnochorda sp. L945t]WRP18498.1 MotA/TolQ/ExbB proton channel family protein [Limnochorda sp. L945t]